MTQFCPRFGIYTFVKPIAMERLNSDRINAILESLEGMDRATPPPFLYTRVLARMEREQAGSWSGVLQFLSRPTIAIAVSMLLVFLNAYVVFSGSDASPAPSEENGMAMVQDYDVHFTASYEPLSDDAP